MFSILLVGLVIVVVCIFPTMYVARWLEAGKSDLVDCIIAILVGTLLSSLAVQLLPILHSRAFLAMLGGLLITGVVYKFMLETTYRSGFLIALIPTLLGLVLNIIFK